MIKNKWNLSQTLKQLIKVIVYGSVIKWIKDMWKVFHKVTTWGLFFQIKTLPVLWEKNLKKNIDICITESSFCIPETNTVNNYTSIKIHKNNKNTAQQQKVRKFLSLRFAEISFKIPWLGEASGMGTAPMPPWTHFLLLYWDDDTRHIKLYHLPWNQTAASTGWLDSGIPPEQVGSGKAADSPLPGATLRFEKMR